QPEHGGCAGIERGGSRGLWYFQGSACFLTSHTCTVWHAVWVDSSATDWPRTPARCAGRRAGGVVAVVDGMGNAAGGPHYRHRPVLSCSRPALSRRIAPKWLKAADGRRQYPHQGGGGRLPHDQGGNQGPTAARNEGSGCAMAAASGARQVVIVGVSGGWQSGAVVGLSDFAPGRAMPLLAWRSEVVMSADIGV